MPCKLARVRGMRCWIDGASELRAALQKERKKLAGALSGSSLLQAKPAAAVLEIRSFDRIDQYRMKIHLSDKSEL